MPKKIPIQDEQQASPFSDLLGAIDGILGRSSPDLKDHLISVLKALASRHRREPMVAEFVRSNIEALRRPDAALSIGDFNAVMEQAATIHLGLDLLDAARTGDAQRIEALGQRNAPVNFRDPRTGATPLHYVAAYRARAAFRALMKGGACDFLIRDGKGRLAWELAVDAGDAAMARLLICRTRRQAEAAGLPFPPRRPAG